MHAHRASPGSPWTLRSFAALALATCAIEASVTRTPLFHRGAAVPLAILFDLVVVLPLLFTALVLRPAKRSLLDATPVLTLGAFVAGALLAGRAETKLPLRVVGALTELAVMAAVVRRVRRASGQLRGAASDDLLLRVGTLTDPLLRVAGAEFLVFYYALVGPFVRRPLRANELSYTENSGLGGLLLALGFVSSMEGVSVHLLLHTWSARAAWIMTAFTAYALLWFVAVYQAARLRPVVVSAESLLVRSSVLWTVEVPRSAITSVTAVDAMPSDKRGVLRAALGTSPVLLITLSRAVVARGPLGIHRSVDRIALYVDDPSALCAALAT